MLLSKRSEDFEMKLKEREKRVLFRVERVLSGLVGCPTVSLIVYELVEQSFRGVVKRQKVRFSLSFLLFTTTLENHLEQLERMSIVLKDAAKVSRSTPSGSPLAHSLSPFSD